MAERFKASNGFSVSEANSYYVYRVFDEVGVAIKGLVFHEAKALREFFQHERDKELGRWRWPENPDYVVYPSDDGGCTVFHEVTSGFIFFSDRTLVKGTSEKHRAARAYFEAHSEPKPWELAKPGEVWVLTISNRGEMEGNDAFEVTKGLIRFYSTIWGNYDLDSECIIAGRRIWPEGDGE